MLPFDIGQTKNNLEHGQDEPPGVLFPASEQKKWIQCLAIKTYKPRNEVGKN